MDVQEGIYHCGLFVARKDFHKHFSIIKPEPCLNLGNAISKEYRMFCQILKSNFIFQRLQKTLHPDSFHIC